MCCKGDKYGFPVIPMDSRFPVKCMMEIDYQKKIFDYYIESIKCCPHCNGDCCSELPKESECYVEGPEIAYVGEHYGVPPRILFTRLNPIKVKKSKPIFFFGSRESLKEYQDRNSDSDAKDIFYYYLNGWNNKGKCREYIGLRYAGTVTGHPNASNKKDDNDPRYGIQIIMNKMIEAGIFDKPGSSPLEFCAINNVIKCAGEGGSSNPGGVMFKTCNWYKGEFDILKPHIVIAFGNKTDNYIRSRSFFMEHCFYFKFPHPLGAGKYSWAGRDIEIPDLNEEPPSTFELGMKEQRKRLFNYILHVVKIAKNLKAALGEQNKP